MDTPVSLTAHFAALPDPRHARGKDHRLLDILVIALCGAICGAEGWVEIAEYGNAKRGWFDSFLDLPNGIPSHDTFGRVFAALDPDQFQQCFLAWVRAALPQHAGSVIAVDGKPVRRSHDRGAGKAAIHMVSAWASAEHLVLGQVCTDAKSNEITAIPALLDGLLLEGCIVTIDAMGCQTAIAAQIIAQEGEYVLAVKENHPNLAHEIAHLFADGQETAFADYDHDVVETLDGGHGRVEVRRCWTIHDAETLAHVDPKGKWAGLAAIALVEAERHIGESVTRERRYYLTSLTRAKEVARAVRAHWGIENSLHWVLDVAFREDECRVRVGHAAANFAVLRHLALNLLKAERTAKVGVKTKRLKAGWDERYLLKILSP